MEADTNVSLPQYALPDLANMGKSWVFPITKYVNSINETYTDFDPNIGMPSQSNDDLLLPHQMKKRHSFGRGLNTLKNDDLLGMFRKLLLHIKS